MELPKNILIIRLSAMGDVAMIVPVLRAFTAHYPKTKVSVLTRNSFAPFFNEFPNVKVITPDLKKSHKGIFGIYRLATELKKKEFDYILDLHDVLRSKILRYFLRSDALSVAVIDKGRSAKKEMTRNQKKKLVPLKSTHQRYADVFEKIGFEVNLEKHFYPQFEEVRKNTLTLFHNLYPDFKKHEYWIGIAPFAKHPGKTYPIDLMEEMIENLVEENVLILLFGGGASEKETLQSIDNLYPNVISIAGKLNLIQEMNLIANLDLMISMDSANMHIASNMNTRVLSLWGATHPSLGFYGFGQNLDDALLPDPVLFPNLPSSTYGNKIFPGYEDAMRSIDPSEILERIKSILNL